MERMIDFFEFDEMGQDELKRINNEHENVLSPYATKNSNAVRFYKSKYDDNLVRTPFSVDVDKILYHPQYNRYSDKTQVFSFCSNDDITRRALHVQLVSKIARTIGRALRLNLDLIEAIALGHDMGHTPFGHKGEFFLSNLYQEYADKKFNHNVHSVRLLKDICPFNLTAQTLDGILCHNGEKVYKEYCPNKMEYESDFESVFQSCYTDDNIIKSLKPSTLEGCVVRISDIIAYVGRDRQDQFKLKLLRGSEFKHKGVLGTSNSDIISNTTLNIIKNSLGKSYIGMDEEVYKDLYALKEENNKIYRHPDIDGPYDEVIRPMFVNLFKVLMDDVMNGNSNSVIHKHYLNDKFYMNRYLILSNSDIKSIAADIVTDFLASMTDDYFLNLHKYLFADDELNNEIKVKGYFIDIE